MAIQDELNEKLSVAGLLWDGTEGMWWDYNDEGELQLYSSGEDN